MARTDPAKSMKTFSIRYIFTYFDVGGHKPVRDNFGTLDAPDENAAREIFWGAIMGNHVDRGVIEKVEINELKEVGPRLFPRPTD